MAPFNSYLHLRLKAGRLVFSSCEVHLMDERARKNAEMPAFNSNGGAGRENRTLISSLENLHTNHCTIPAYIYNVPVNLGWDIGIEPTTFWTTIRRSNHLS